MSFARLSSLALVCALGLAGPSFAKTTGAKIATQKSPSPDSSYVWQFFQFKNADAGNSDTVQIVYAIPETDAIDGAVTCLARDKGKASLDLSADVGHGANGDKVRAKVFGQAMDATITLPASGEGLAGFSVPLVVGDALMSKLASQASLVYSLNGEAERKIPLSQGKSVIRKFIRACNGFAGKK